MSQIDQQNAPVAEQSLFPSGPLLEQIMLETRIQPADESYSLARKGIEIFLAEIISNARYQERIEKALIDRVIAEIDRKISEQMDEILHQKEFQELESAWRGLRLLVDRTNSRENIEITLLNVNKEQLIDDFIDNPEITMSGFYKHVYSSEYGQFGGKPVGAIIGNYTFGPGQSDILLLRNIAGVSAMAHAPFIAAAGSEFFGQDSYEDIPGIKDMNAIFDSPRYAKWHSFRESEDSRYIGLTLPRFLLRAPYNKLDNSVREFDYDENTTGNHAHYLWGNAAFAFATRLTDSFARYRWCPNIIGPQNGGAVEDLPVHYFAATGVMQAKIPVEALISDRKEFELAEQGFITLTMRKGADSAAFFSANSIQKPRQYANNEQGREDSTNYKLGTQLPYLFIITRLAHYIKVLQREQIGSWKTRADLQREINTWLRQYVSDQENPPSSVRSRRPLRAAEVSVSDVPGDPGWFAIDLSVVPHFKYMGANFTLTLKGKLETQ